MCACFCEVILVSHKLVYFYFYSQFYCCEQITVLLYRSLFLYTWQNDTAYQQPSWRMKPCVKALHGHWYWADSENLHVRPRILHTHIHNHTTVKMTISKLTMCLYSEGIHIQTAVVEISVISHLWLSIHLLLQMPTHNCLQDLSWLLLPQVRTGISPIEQNCSGGQINHEPGH